MLPPIRKTIRVRKYSPIDPLPLCLIIVLIPYVLTVVYQETDTSHIWDRITHKPEDIIPLQTERANTTSKEWPMDKQDNPRYVQIHDRVLRSLNYHLESHHHSCLCMHHLVPVVKSRFRMCAIYLRGTHDAITLLNPYPKGMTKEGYMYREQSVMCGNTTTMETRRTKTLLLDWFTPGGQRVSGIFYGVRAACLQLAMEEMEGSVKCK